MEPWVDTISVVLIAGFGVFLGRTLSSLGKAYWIPGFIVSCLIIAILATARFNLSLYFVKPVLWLTSGRFRYLALSFAISLGLTVPLSQLIYKWEKYTVCVLMMALLIWASVLPSLFPAFIKGQLARIVTRYDKDGICRQTTDYTCGPAAAVTALGMLGLSAEEGELAILSHSSPVTGTLPGQLCSVLQSRFGDSGLRCQYRRFESIEQLKESEITLVVVKDAVMLDHCVVVLEVGDFEVAVADPVTGKELIPYEQFERIWRFSGIAMERTSLRGI
jgi:predicted double-glycine peptidase